MILFGSTFLAGLVGVIFIGIVNFFILPNCSFLVDKGVLSHFSSFLSFSEGEDARMFLLTLPGIAITIVTFLYTLVLARFMTSILLLFKSHVKPF